MASTEPVSHPGSGQALFLSTLAFTLCFAVWTLLSIIGIPLSKELNLSDTELALLIATPVLTGSISRPVLGILTDRFGGRPVMGILLLVSAGCVYLLTLARSYPMLLLAALGLGLAGGAFAVGTAYVSRWFGGDRQGTALGVFGAGNMGSSLTNFAAPLLLVALGWQGTTQVYALVLALMGLGFLVFARDPRHPTPSLTLSQRLAPMADLRVWRFSLYYFFVFGAFVALALWLPHYLMRVYGVSLTTAGMITLLFTLPGSLFRILGGWLSDRYGARRVMYWTFIACLICTFLLSYPPTEYRIQGIDGELRFSLNMGLPPFVLLIMVLGFFMSLGKAAVFKHIPTYYPEHVGAVGGVVGMVGGLGGFFLPLTFGMLNDVVGIWQSCFMLLFVLVAGALAWMHYAIIKANRVEWTEQRETGDLPELSTPSKLVLQDWRPEDTDFWEHQGRAVARRNLWISIPNLVLAFSVWMVWSVVVARLPQVGFDYSANQLFWLAALPGLSGATLRVFYSFMVPIFGGRRWTAFSTASLLLPALWIGFAVRNPDTPYLVMLVLALLCGFGGGNFASSMANISFFFPKKEKGAAMGLNAGLGNLGVSLMQFLVPLVITTGVFAFAVGDPQMTADGERLWLQNAGFVWVPFIVAATVAAWFGMNDIASAKSSFQDQAVIFRRKHNWLMCVLYTGTFGSFIGFAAAFPLLSSHLFPEVDALKLAFLGPLLGALSRAFSGGVSDRLGGGRVTFWVFAGMIAGVIGLLWFLDQRDQPGAFVGFFVCFLWLFLVSGVGNSSTFQMVPAIFRHEVARLMPDRDAREQQLESDREAAAVVGFTSAIAAYGAFFIPKAFGTALELTGGAEPALYGFLLFYVLCLGLTWFYYTRKKAVIPC